VGSAPARLYRVPKSAALLLSRDLDSPPVRCLATAPDGGAAGVFGQSPAPLVCFVGSGGAGPGVRARCPEIVAASTQLPPSRSEAARTGCPRPWLRAWRPWPGWPATTRRRWCWCADEHGDHGVAQHRGGDALNGGRVGVGDQVAAAASLSCLGLTPRARLKAVLSAYGVVEPTW